MQVAVQVESIFYPVCISVECLIDYCLFLCYCNEDGVKLSDSCTKYLASFNPIPTTTTIILVIVGKAFNQNVDGIMCFFFHPSTATCYFTNW